LRHTNADALSRNPVGQATDDDDFNEKIQDLGSPVTDTSKKEKETLFVQTGEDTEWLGVWGKDRGCVQHNVYCDHVGSQQLHMVDVISKEDQAKELEPHEAEIARESEPMQDENVRVVLKRRKPQCYDR